MLDYIVMESRGKAMATAWSGEGTKDVRDELEAALVDVDTQVDPRSGIPLDLVAQLEAYQRRMGMVS